MLRSFRLQRLIAMSALGLWVLFLGFTSTGLAEDTSIPFENQHYYLRIQNNDFLETLIIKEAFLLGIVQSVNEELSKGRSEGLAASDLGIEDFIDPDEVLLDDYIQEFERIRTLLVEVNRLENMAMGQAHFQVIEGLSNLRASVEELLKLEQYYVQDDEFNPAFSDQEGGGDDSIENQTQEQESATQPASVSDLFSQWKYNRLLSYELKLTEYKLIRSRLLQSSSAAREERMFKGYLRKALENYQIGDYALARLQLKDILETFSHYRYLDDVLYYSCESAYGLNYLDEASDGYRQLVREYPDSPFHDKALIKLLNISYIYQDYDRIFGVYRILLESRDDLEVESLGIVSYLVGSSHLKQGDYSDAIAAFSNVPELSSYYYPAQYLMATCHANMNNQEQALAIYHRLVDEENGARGDQVLAQIQNNALLKLGLIYYERKENQAAIDYFSRVSINFQNYDLSVIGKAWSAYRSGRPGEALMNAEWILRNSMISKYAYEARVLAAQSKELLGHSEEAIQDFKEVFRIGKRARQLIPDADEQEAVTEGIEELDRGHRQLLEEREWEIFSEVEEIRNFLLTPSATSRGAGGEEIASSDEFSDTAQELLGRIDDLDRMEAQATNYEDDPLVDEIRHLRSDFIQTLTDHSGNEGIPSPIAGEDPIVQRMGMSEYMKYSFQTLLDETLREKKAAGRDIEEASRLLEDAREQEQLDLVLHTEMRKNELEEYYGRLNQYEVWLRENFPEEFHVEMGQWVAFSGYGISDINFSKIKETETRMARISQTIAMLDHVFNAKKKMLENRIQGLLTDVSKIEEQMLSEAEKRQQQQKDRFFKTEYFDRQRKESLIQRLRERPKLIEQEEE